jgi:hypothetical protein
MQLAMVSPADRHNELVAHSAPERAGLGKGQVMRIGRHTAAYKAGLPQHEFSVVLIAQPNRFSQSMDYVPAGLLLGPPRSCVAGSGVRPTDGHCTLLLGSLRLPGSGKTIRCPTEWRSLKVPVIVPAIADCREPRLKLFLEHFGVGCGQGVLGGHMLLRPNGRLVRRIYGRQLLDQAFAQACR